MIRPDSGLHYFQPSPAQQAVGLWVAGAGRQAKDAADRCLERSLPGYAVVLVERGSGHFDSRPSGRLSVAAPAMLWLFPGIVHSYWADPAWDERWLLFDGPLLEALRAAEALVPAEAVQPAPLDGACQAAFGRCWAAAHAAHPLATALASAALHELIVASQVQRLGYESGGRPRDHLVAGAIALIEAPGGDTRSPEGLAAELGIPYSTLRRRFRSVTGGSLRDYAIGCRLGRAKRLLVGTTDPIHVVAGHCGFEDPYYFTRLFSRRVGLSPSTFRQSGQL